VAHPSSLAELLNKARQRSVLHLLLHQLVLTAAIVLGGAALILLAGTESVSWLWLIVLAVASFGTILFLSRKKFPSVYDTAQGMDARLHLADTLSTAAFFSDAPGNRDESIRQAQRRQAEKLAESVDLKSAVPFKRPRSLYAALALAAIVGGIFLLRFALLGSFDPRAPLVQNAYDNLFRPAKQQAKAGSQPENGDQPGDGREESKESPRNNDFAGDPSAQPNDPTAPDKPNDQKSQQAENQDQKGDSQNDGKDQQDSASANDNKQGDKQQEGNQDAKAQQDPSLLNKVRQALNDMLNKMKSSPNESAKNQQGDQQNPAEQQNGPDAQAQDKGDSQPAQNGKQSSDAQDGSNNSQNKPSQEQQNGIGSQEGEKAAKEAEALKAMGKITELLGKRAENVKGAVMVEVGSTKQQLKTQVTQNQTAHTDAGSEIHRDQVPPAYEQFVQQYFENIRKSSPNIPQPPVSSSKQ
jgi:hypothetical protein